MPRIRTVKPEFFSDEKLAAMPMAHRFVFIGLISMADDAGRLIDHLRAIDGYIFPLSDETAEPSLRALTEASVIRRYIAPNGQRVIQIVNWLKHQRIERPSQSKLAPEVTPLSEKALQPIADDVVKARRWLTDNAVKPHRPDVEVEVGDGKEVRSSEGRDGERGRLAVETATAAPASTNGHHPEPEDPVPPRPPYIPEPVATEPAENGPDPFAQDRRAAAAWVKDHKAEYEELARQVVRENPVSESAGGRKAFISALLLGRIKRILAGHDQPPKVPA